MVSSLRVENAWVERRDQTAAGGTVTASSAIWTWFWDYRVTGYAMISIYDFLGEGYLMILMSFVFSTDQIAGIQG